MTPEVLWQHERVVEQLMDARDVLPVRYGTEVSDEAAVERILAENYDRLAESLERVRGATEVSVRAYRPPAQAAEAGVAEADVAESGGQRLAESGGHESRPGTAYLRARAGSLAAEREAVAAIHEPLAATVRAATLRQTRSADEVLCAAYLLDRRGVSRFSSLLADLQEANPDLRLTCTGPWPPYSFAEPDDRALPNV